MKSIFLHLDNLEGALFAQYNLSVARYYALQHIHTYPGLSLQELTTHLLCDKSNATRLARGLEADGWIERRPHPSDGRMLQLYLTDKGEALYAQVAAAHAARVDEIFEPLADELITLQAAADRLEQHLASQTALYPPVVNNG
ncbi:MAG: hypothetical protein OHK0052_11340 [Anaerolineales bacterium]